jgi:hypothetical protein
MNPTSGAVIGSPSIIIGGDQDKPWIAADKNPSSPFANRVYVVWHDQDEGDGVGNDNDPVRFAFSTNQGASWTLRSTPLTSSGEGQTWPADIAAAPNGDVWVAWHVNTGGTGSNGGIRMRRSINAGSIGFQSEVTPFPNGTADVTVNVTSPRIAHMQTWLLGNEQPRILFSPSYATNGTMYVIAADDPDNTYTATGDPSDIVLARSTDFGATWTRTTISHGPAGTIQIMPAAAIDSSGNITVTWYDTRRSLTNSAGDYLLDVYSTTSSDGGLTWGNDIRLDDTPLDPDLGAPDRFPPFGDLRIGEYNGVVSAGGNAFTVWTGNSNTGQQPVFTKFLIGFQVADSTPALGQLVTSPPTDFVVQLTNPVTTSSVQASDLRVNGIAASSVAFNAANDTLTFHYNTSPVTVEGSQTMTIAAGAITRQADSTGIVSFSRSFFYDPQQSVVTTTNPVVGGTFTIGGSTTLDENFNEAVSASSVQTSDLVLSGISGAAVSSVTMQNSNTRAHFTLSGLSTEGTLAASIAAGAITDPSGNPLAAFAASYQIDRTTLSYPTPLQSEYPLGSLVYDPSSTGVINFAGDTDDFTLAVDPGQAITVLVTANSATLQPTIQLTSPSSAVLGTASAAAAGKNALLQTIAAATSGTYTIRVGGAGATTGNYTVQVYLNAAVESANVGVGDDTTLGAAQDLTAAFTALQTTSGSAAMRAAVIGSVSATATLAAIDSGWWDNNGNHTANNKNYIAGRNNHDFFVFDLATVRQPIVSGQFNVAMPPTGYNSVDPSEPYALFDVSTSISALRATNSGQTAIFNDLASGTTYGTRVYSAADNGTLTSIPLNSSGIAVLNSAFAGQAAFGGALTDTSSSGGQAIFSSSGEETNTKQLALLLASSDFYSFHLAAGQRATIGLKNLSGGGTTVALQNSGGVTLATGIAAGNLDQVISNFAAPADGTYYLVVTASGTAATYNLTVTRDATFDTEPNDTFSMAQPLDGSSGAIGAFSQTAVVPSQLVNTAGGGANGYPFNIAAFGAANMRYQQVYSHSEFGQPGTITAIRFRRNGDQSAFTTSGIDLKINLGYSAYSVDTVSSTFASNIGPGSTAVYDSSIDGLLTLSSTATGSAPFPFDVVINLPRPFYYNPSQGELLMDIFMRNSPATKQFDASGGGEQTTTRRIYSTNINASSGALDNSSDSGSYYGLITRFDMAPTDDWYAIDSPNRASQLTLETSTPADGANQFVNALNPHLELYDPQGNLVDVGAPLGDGRNEALDYLPPAGGTYRIRVLGEGNTTGEYFLSRRISEVNVAPIVTSLAVASPIDEGSLATLTGTIDDPNSADPHTLVVTWGPGEDSTTYDLPAGQLSFSVTHLFADDDPSGTSSDTYPISVTVTDGGGLSASGSTTVTVNNVAPALSDLSVVPILENGTTTLTGRISDMGTLDTFTVVIDWGNGSQTFTNVGAGTFSYGRQYLDDRAASGYPISVSVTDDDGGSVVGDASVLVTNVPPLLTTSGSGSTNEGALYTLTLASSDPGADTITHWTINWGDGSAPEMVAGNPPSVTHVYLDGPNQFTISAAATDEDGTFDANNLAVTVSNLAPTATDNDYSTDPAMPLSGNVITDSTGYGVDSDPAGDQDPLTVSDYTLPGNGTLVVNPNGTFTYTPDSTFAGDVGFRYTISDGDGGLATATVTIHVAAASPGSILVIPDSCLGGTALLVTGTSAADQIVVEPGASSSIVQVTVNGVLSFWPTPSGRIIVIGGAGDDNIQIAGSIANPVWLYGDAGNDRLNAGNGGSLLIGGDGNDELLGGNGRDAMIGGEGADHTVGNGNDDILVAGLTDRDSRSTASHEEFWCSVLEEWNSAQTFASRVLNLRSATGGLIPHVLDDLSADAIDLLNGAAGSDWLIFLAGEDKVAGQVEAAY